MKIMTSVLFLTVNGLLYEPVSLYEKMTKLTIIAVLLFTAVSLCCADDLQTWKECYVPSHHVKDNSDGLNTCTEWCQVAHKAEGMQSGRCVWYRQGHYCLCMDYYWG